MATDILTPDEVDAIDMAAHNGEHTDGDLAALITTVRAQAARIEELEEQLAVARLPGVTGVDNG